MVQSLPDVSPWNLGYVHKVHALDSKTYIEQILHHFWRTQGLC